MLPYCSAWTRACAMLCVRHYIDVWLRPGNTRSKILALKVHWLHSPFLSTMSLLLFAILLPLPLLLLLLPNIYAIIIISRLLMLGGFFYFILSPPPPSYHHWVLLMNARFFFFATKQINSTSLLLFFMEWSYICIKNAHYTQCVCLELLIHVLAQQQQIRLTWITLEAKRSLILLHYTHSN